MSLAFNSFGVFDTQSFPFKETLIEDKQMHSWGSVALAR